ncbi:acyltransferase [Psychrobacter immobilis]|uniref:acyltransferase n=1 Tax=Psychrobacter immobilis TaxID=498 RepID=UPI0019184D0B|nr:acyltransferase [Psychrobacter immobilis]
MHRLSIIYSWGVRLSTRVLPDVPPVMRFRGFLYSFMMKSCGSNFQVSSTSYINSLNGISVGDDVYFAHNVVVLGKEITIENEVMIGPNTVVVSGNHSFLGNSFRFGKSISQPIVIEEGSWISANCSILSGAVLPCRSILAAGSVLNKAFSEEKSLYGGSPAKFIKRLKV